MMKYRLIEATETASVSPGVTRTQAIDVASVGCDSISFSIEINYDTSDQGLTGTVILQQSNDAVNWVDLGSSATFPYGITTQYLETFRPTTKYIAVAISFDDGEVNATLKILGKGDRD